MKRLIYETKFKIAVAVLSSIAAFPFLTTFTPDSNAEYDLANMPQQQTQPQIPFSNSPSVSEPIPGQESTPAITPMLTPAPTPSIAPTPNTAATPSAAPTPAPELTPVPNPEPTPAPGPTLAPNPGPTPAPESNQAGTLDSLAKRYNAVSVSVAVIGSDGGLFTYQYGYADKSTGRLVNADTKFRVASLSKIIPVICAMSLADSGLIDIDNDISDYLGYTVRNPNYPDTPITPRMLMQHTSSINDSDTINASISKRSDTDKSVGDLLALNSSYANRRPGASFQYTNFGISVLAAVCEMVSGKLLDTLARDIIFNPLGIDGAYIPSNLKDPSNIGVIYNGNHGVGDSISTALSIASSGVLGRDHHMAQGRLTISAQDYAKILSMLCNNGVYGETRILSQWAVSEIHNANVNGASYMQGLAVRFSKNAFMNSDVYWHTGSAYGELTQFIYSPELNRVVVVITTGASNARTSIGMVTVCTEIAKAVW